MKQNLLGSSSTQGVEWQRLTLVDVCGEVLRRVVKLIATSPQLRRIRAFLVAGLRQGLPRVLVLNKHETLCQR